MYIYTCVSRHERFQRDDSSIIYSRSLGISTYRVAHVYRIYYQSILSVLFFEYIYVYLYIYAGTRLSTETGASLTFALYTIIVAQTFDSLFSICASARRSYVLYRYSESCKSALLDSFTLITDDTLFKTELRLWNYIYTTVSP